MVKEEGKPKEWRSIKVRENTYEELKKMGEGIGKAVDILVKEQREAFEKKIGEVDELAGDIATVLFDSGIFDIKFKGMVVEKAAEYGSLVRFRGYVDIDIPNAEARIQIIDLLTGEEEEEEEEEEAEDEQESESDTE